jgi:hypothetical protein
MDICLHIIGKIFGALGKDSIIHFLQGAKKNTLYRPGYQHRLTMANSGSVCQSGQAYLQIILMGKR